MDIVKYRFVVYILVYMLYVYSVMNIVCFG